MTETTSQRQKLDTYLEQTMLTPLEIKSLRDEMERATKEALAYFDQKKTKPFSPTN
ncbi:MAG: hypothetical protein H6999_00080 [Hahellaceae bacterium]|nr:hypothetical protein [Hahellaceae bacterium]MCP5168148.1 hypothetical protein [Hahellaceae bacterium]